jgi:hypothetical protein
MDSMKIFVLAMALGIPIFAISAVLFAPILQVSVRLAAGQKINYGLSVHIAALSEIAAFIAMIAIVLAVVNASLNFYLILILLPVIMLFSTAFFVRDMLFFERRLSVSWGRALAASVLYAVASSVLMHVVMLVARLRGIVFPGWL